MKLLRIILITFGFGIFLLAAIIIFEPTNGPTGFFVYTPTLAIVNQENNAALDSNLEIAFLTKGEYDLLVSKESGEMEFLELRCGKETVASSFNEEVIYRDYHCLETSYLIARVLSQQASLKFEFGNEIQTAENIA